MMWLTMVWPAYCGVGLAPVRSMPIWPAEKELTMAMTAPNSIWGFMEGTVM